MQNILLLKARKQVKANDYVTDQLALHLGGGGADCLVFKESKHSNVKQIPYLASNPG